MISVLTNRLSKSTVSASAPGFPIKFSNTPSNYDSPSPIAGEHTEVISGSLAKLSKEEFFYYLSHVTF